MKRRVADWTLEAVDYPYDLARQVLDLFPDEWAAAVAYPEWSASRFYRLGEDIWRLYTGTDVGDRYAEFMCPVQDMLDVVIRAAKLEMVRAKLREDAGAVTFDEIQDAQRLVDQEYDKREA